MKNKILLLSIAFLIAYQAQSFATFTKKEKSTLDTSFKKNQIEDQFKTIKPVFIEKHFKQDDTLVYSDASLTVKPEFPGGVESFNAHVNIFLKKANNKKNNVFMTFIVEKNGQLSNIKIFRTVDAQTTQETDNEILEIIKKSPKWKAGELDGKKVRCMIPLFLTVNEG